ITLDHGGPLTRSVRDAATMWSVLAARPDTPLAPPAPGTIALGVAVGYFANPIADEVRGPFDAALGLLRNAGVNIRPVEIAGTDKIVETYSHISLPEAAVWHAKYMETRPADYTSAVRTRLEVGQKTTAVQYLAARQRRLTFIDAVDAALTSCQALVLPT